MNIPMEASRGVFKRWISNIWSANRHISVKMFWFFNIYIYTLRLFPNNCTLQYFISNRHRCVSIKILRHVTFCTCFFYLGYYTPFSFMVFLFYHPTCWVLKTMTMANTVITMHCYSAFRLTRRCSPNWSIII